MSFTSDSQTDSLSEYCIGMTVESLKRKKMIESIEIIELGLVRDRGSACPPQLTL
jgi:hypothetical protein